MPHSVAIFRERLAVWKLLTPPVVYSRASPLISGGDVLVPRESDKTAGTVAKDCNPNIGNVEKGELPGLTSSQASLLAQLQSYERPCVKKQDRATEIQ